MIGAALISVVIVSTAPDLSQELPAAYEIKAYLNDSTHTISGTEAVTFLNPTDRPLNSIAFHMYPNAFQNRSTVYCREDRHTRERVAGGNISEVDIRKIAVNDRKIEEGGYVVHGTRLYIDLERPLLPGRKIDIGLEFEILIPEMIGHFGYDSDGAYLIAHCFPILCGYQKGRLIDWEYHANSEFFSNFSFYDVTIELPPDFKAFSTGSIRRESENDSSAVWRVHADTVIDFALACGPGLKEFESEIDGIKLRYLLKEKHADLFPLADSAMKNSVRYCGDLLFPYPYAEFALADMGFTNAGLELPGLIVTGLFGAEGKMRNIFLKKTIAHEIAHQWFYAAIATNEFEEPWLDEGFASFLEFKIAREYGFDSFPMIFANYSNSDRSLRRLFTLMQGPKYPINLKSWDYPDRGSYTAAVYGRAWMILQALENSLGDSVFAEAIRIFAENYRFRHPDQEDFFASISASSSEDLAEFIDMFVEGTARVDYAIEKIEFEKTEAAGDSGKTKYETYVTIERKLGGILPQTVTVGFEDGTRTAKIWDGKNRIIRMEFEGNSRPLWASIDKDVSYAIDENMNNNTIYLEGHMSRMISFEWDAIFIIEFLASIFL
jgi:hypothetical protein